MEGIELASFQIISAVGEAKSNYIEAIRVARKGDFEASQKLILEGDSVFVKGHEVHMGLIQQEASNADNSMVNLLLMHAEDQLMSTETIKVLAIEMIETIKMIK